MALAIVWWLGSLSPNGVFPGARENIQLKSREPRDYQVAVPEAAGTNHDIFAMETSWKLKFQIREKRF